MQMEATHLFEMSMKPISGSRNYVYNLINNQNKFIRTSLLFQKSAGSKLPDTRLIPVLHHSFHSCAWFKENKRAADIAIKSCAYALNSYIKNRKDKCLVLNVHHVGSMLLSAVPTSIAFDLPIVVTSHGTGIYQNYDNSLIRHALETNVDMVIAVSKAVKNFISSKTDFSTKRIKVIYPGVDTGVFSPSNFSSEIFKIYGDYVLFFGRIDYEKGAHLLPQIAEKLPKNLKLIIVGDGKALSEIAMQVKKKNLANKVVFTGYVPEDKLKALVATAKVTLIPSMFEEPFPLVFLESIASGIPVVMSKKGGMNEIRDSAGILKVALDPSEFASAAVKLATETTGKTKNRLMKIASEFSWESIAEKYVELYKKLI